jgi:hypothetical protein
MKERPAFGHAAVALQGLDFSEPMNSTSEFAEMDFFATNSRGPPESSATGSKSARTSYLRS